MVAREGPVSRDANYNIWERWHNPPTSATHLKVLTRQVVGLREVSDGMGATILSGMLRQDPKTIRAIIRQVKKSRHPVIKMVRKHGLPMSAVVHLPEEVTVRCKDCHGKLCEVPCIRCRVKGVRTVHERPPNGKGFPDIGHGTPYPPGSWGKVEVMRRRLALGYSAFSSKDTL